MYTVTHLSKNKVIFLIAEDKYNLKSLIYIDLLTIKCTTLKTQPVFEPLFILPRNSTISIFFTQKYKLWPFLIKHDHNLCFGVNTYTCCAISMKNKKWFKNWSRF